MRNYFLWLAKFITTLVIVFIVIPVVIGSVIAAGVGAVQNPTIGQSKDAGRKVAVVELAGEITSSRDIVDELYKQVNDDSIKAVVLRIDSPGGSVGPSQEIYSTVLRLRERKPIVVSMGALAASGGMYIAAAGSKVYAQPGTLTGSIGVVMQLPNFTDIASKVGFEMITVKSGKLKDVGNQFRKVTPEEIAYLEDTIQRTYVEFFNAISVSRNIPKEKLTEFADGRIIVGTQAKEFGLVDEIGDIYDAAKAALELAGIKLKDKEDPYLLYPSDKYKELKKLLEGVSSLTIFSGNTVKLKYIMDL